MYKILLLLATGIVSLLHCMEQKTSLSHVPDDVYKLILNEVIEKTIEESPTAIQAFSCINNLKCTDKKTHKNISALITKNRFHYLRKLQEKCGNDYTPLIYAATIAEIYEQQRQQNILVDTTTVGLKTQFNDTFHLINTHYWDAQKNQLINQHYPFYQSPQLPEADRNILDRTAQQHIDDALQKRKTKGYLYGAASLATTGILAAATCTIV